MLAGCFCENGCNLCRIPAQAKPEQVKGTILVDTSSELYNRHVSLSIGLFFFYQKLVSHVMRNMTYTHCDDVEFGKSGKNNEKEKGRENTVKLGPVRSVEICSN